MNATSKVSPGARFYLVFSAIGLVPIALGYGFAPRAVLPMILDIPVETTDLAHVLRAVMGLYLALVALWLLGAWRVAWTRAAIGAEIAFMSGLAAGRLLSLVADGMPSAILVVYLVLEVGMAAWGIGLLRRTGSPDAAMAA